MTTTLVATGVVVIVLLTALALRYISVFLFLFSMSALLAANGLVPVGAGDTMVFLAIASLWVELAQIEKRGVAQDRTEPDDVGWSLLAGAVLGLLAGLIVWFAIDEAVPFVLIGAYGGAFFMAVATGKEKVHSFRQALLLVEHVPHGLVLKLIFCALVLVSLVK